MKIIKRIIRKICNFAGIGLVYPWIALGSNQLIFKNFDKARSQVPKSVRFNTGSGKIIVGENTVFGEGVQVLTGKHLTIFDVGNDLSRLQEVPKYGRDIIIGDNCYIGSNAIIIGPVQIGNYAVIGAGAVVSIDVPEKSFVDGNPAKIIMKL